MTLAAFRERAAAAGARAPHVDALLRAWLAGKPIAFLRSNPRHPPPKSLLAALPALAAELEPLAALESEHPDGAGATRLLVQLARGGRVESVLLPRAALCVSTQIGCAVGCRFCETGKTGLLRQLEADEIAAQLALGRSRAEVKRVVLMGMGEPAHNLPAVLDALALLWTHGGLAHENLVFSTVGDLRAFEALAAHAVHPTLALSLHTTDLALRSELLPRAPRIAPAELVERAAAYGAAVDLPVQLQWTLLAGVNDGDAEAERLIELVRGRRMMVNYIPFNPVEGSGFARPDWERGIALVRRLKRAGVFATLRRSGAQAVDGGCGQLRARAEASARGAPS